jgi:hypothetical protein
MTRFVLKSFGLFILLINIEALAQTADTLPKKIYFKSQFVVTNNGFSFIPSNSLGKPASLVNFVVAGKRLSFEPEFRFSNDGNPWVFIFIWRYKLINKEKYKFTLGGHLPSVAFREMPFETNGTTNDYLVARRNLALELIPNYSLSKSTSVGLYYLFAHCYDFYAARDISYLSLLAATTQKLSNQLKLNFNPQVYFLRSDHYDGFYTSASMTIDHKKSGLSVGSIVNKAIHSHIPSKDFSWNVSLLYTFDRNYTLNTSK